jgi:putative ABC transport system permease protein
MGVRMKRGQWLTDNEPTAVINERLARREFPGQDPIGRRIRLDASEPALTIVGIAADLRYARLDTAPEPEVYVPYSRVDGMFGFTALVRTAGDPLALAPVIRPLVAGIDQTQIADDVMTLEGSLADSIAPRRWNLYLLGTFAASALVLAIIGLYGLMACWVTQRRQEIGVRMALGARRQEVVRLVVRQGMGIALIGLTVGVISAVALTRLMSSLLYGVSATDPATYAGIALLLAAVALLACYLPARRAMRVDPMVALRYE